MKCPSCVKGTKIGPNGESWRCYRCNGFGKVPDEKPAEKPKEKPEEKPS